MGPGRGCGLGRGHSPARRWDQGGDESLGMDSGRGGGGLEDGSSGRREGYGEGGPGRGGDDPLELGKGIWSGG